MEDHIHIETERAVAIHGQDIGLHKDQINDLFGYRDRLQQSMSNLEIGLESLKKDQHSWAGTLSSNIHRLGEQLTDHCSKVDDSLKRITGLESKNDSFKWFVEPMNKMQGKLPWFLIGIILIGMASFSVSWDLLGKLIAYVGKVFSIFR